MFLRELSQCHSEGDAGGGHLEFFEAILKNSELSIPKGVSPAESMFRRGLGLRLMAFVHKEEG